MSCQAKVSEVCILPANLIVQSFFENQEPLLGILIEQEIQVQLIWIIPIGFDFQNTIFLKQVLSSTMSWIIYPSSW